MIKTHVLGYSTLVFHSQHLCSQLQGSCHPILSSKGPLSSSIYSHKQVKTVLKNDDAVEVSQWLEHLLSFVEKLAFVPSTHIKAHKCLQRQS